MSQRLRLAVDEFSVEQFATTTTGPVDDLAASCTTEPGT